jgi:putative AlgH/UPF0301 family transcriptional regulator
MYATFEGFEIEMTKKSAISMSHSGDCKADVAYYLKTNKSIQKQLAAIGNEKIAEVLRGYGAWDETQLADAEANKRRIVWIAANDIREDNRL